MVKKLIALIVFMALLTYACGGGLRRSLSGKSAGNTANSSGGGSSSGSNTGSGAVNGPGQTYSIGGSITGLSGTLVLQNNGQDPLTRSSNGAFTFPTALLSGATYSVSIATQPSPQACFVTHGNGTTSNANVSNIDVTCFNRGANIGQTLVSASGESQFYNVAKDSSNNLYAVGYIKGTSSYTFGTGISVSGANAGTNLVIVKFNSSGSAQWAQTISGSTLGASKFLNVAIDSSDNVYAVGNIGTGTYSFGNGVTATGTNASGNLILVKYSSSGTAQFAQTTSSPPGTSGFYGVTVDSSNNIYAVGDLEGNTAYNFGNGITASGHASLNNAVIVKYNSSGIAQWANSTDSGALNSQFVTVIVDASGNITAAGHITGVAGPASNSTYGFGNSITARCFAQNNTSCPVIARYSSSGVAQWAATSTAMANPASNGQFLSLAADSSNNIYAAGSIWGGGSVTFGSGSNNVVTGPNSTDNGLIVKYNTSGVAQWAQTAAVGPNTSTFNGIAVDSSDNIYLVGNILGNSTYTFGSVSLTGTASGSAPNLFLLKVDSTGTFQSGRTTVSGTLSSNLNGLTTLGPEVVYAVGTVTGSSPIGFENSISVTGPSAANLNALLLNEVP